MQYMQLYGVGLIDAYSVFSDGVSALCNTRNYDCRNGLRVCVCISLNASMNMSFANRLTHLLICSIVLLFRCAVLCFLKCHPFHRSAYFLLMQMDIFIYTYICVS